VHFRRKGGGNEKENIYHEQIISKLREADVLLSQGQKAGEGSRKSGISERIIGEGRTEECG
jgi:hypothetical protein